MKAFQFRTVPSVIVELGAARRLGAVLRERFAGLQRLCVVTDGFLHGSGLLDPALADLAAHGWQVTVTDDVVADPPEPVVVRAAGRVRAAGAERGLGLGGGSSMDVARLLAVLVTGRQPLGEMYGVGRVAATRLPLVQMPTTAGTGSEMTAVSIVTTGEATKLGVVAPQRVADLAVLDAEPTLGLPRAATAATGIDAMVHAIEALYLRASQEPGVGCAGAAVGQPAAGLRRRHRPRRARSEALIAHLEAITAATGIARTLREVGVGEADAMVIYRAAW